MRAALSEANAINEDGQAAGTAATSSSASGAHAARWGNGTITDLTPGIPAGDAAIANGINDAGQIVGAINYATPFIWQNGALTTLGHLGGGGGVASDVNNAGQAVGLSYTQLVAELGFLHHAVLWQNGTTTDLGVLPGDEDSAAAAINALGQIAGSSGRTDPVTYVATYRAFVHDAGVMTALPVPSSESYAGDINDAGVVVGTMRAGAGFSNFHAWIYADGVVTDLNTLVPSGSGLQLAYAAGINNAGQIVGTAYDAQGRYHAFLLTPVAPGTPVLNIADATVTEGHTGTRAASLTVSLSAASSQPVTVSYATSNGSAAAGTDYQSASGTVTFSAGETAKTISVGVTGDRTGEPNETVLVNIGQVEGAATIADGQGILTIVDDEPRLSIADVSKKEGNAGTSLFVFTVSLSSPSPVAVTASFATADGSAKALEDYDASTGALAFSPGETTKAIAVVVKGDRKLELNEVFQVNLSDAAGAFVARGQASGTILNDDR